MNADQARYLLNRADQLTNWDGKIENSRRISRLTFSTECFDEAIIFRESMAQIDKIAFSRRWSGSESIQKKSCLVIAAQSYQMLLSTWDDLEGGRPSSALALLRPIIESLTYLRAADLDEEFARRWSDSSVSRGPTIQRAMRVLKRYSGEHPNHPGKDGPAILQSWTESFQSYPHVDMRSAAVALGAGPDDFDVYPQPHGAFNGLIKSLAGVCAGVAAEVLRTTAAAFCAPGSPEYNETILLLSLNDARLASTTDRNEDLKTMLQIWFGNGSKEEA